MCYCAVRKIEPIPYSPPPKPPTPVPTNAKEKAAEGKGGKKGGKDAEKAAAAVPEPVIVVDTIRYDTIRDAILTCVRKPT